MIGRLIQSYPQKYVPSIGQDGTWKIGRKNLYFRTHLKRSSRKSICFSKNEQIHDNIIGMYIEKYYFKQGTFGGNFQPKPRV